MEMNEKIKLLRIQKGLTLEQVGDYVGVGKSTVRKWENGLIENMRRDKIAKLAFILGTTPDYLMGWGNKDDEWSANFRKSLSEELATIERTDAADSCVDYDRLESLSCDTIPVSLSEACTIADELGTSLDRMVGLEHLDEQTAEFINLFSKLSDTQQDMIIASMRGILSNK